MLKRNQLSMLIGIGVLGVLLALVVILLTSNYYTTHASGISDSGTPHKQNTTGMNINKTASLIVDGTAVQFTDGKALVTINQQHATVTTNGTVLAITDATNSQNAKTGQDMNGSAATTLMVNGTAVQLIRGQAKVMINRQIALVTVNGNIINITDEATNSGYDHSSHW